MIKCRSPKAALPFFMRSTAVYLVPGIYFTFNMVSLVQTSLRAAYYAYFCCCCCCCCRCPHMSSSPQYNAVRGHRTGSKNSGVKEIPRQKKYNKQKVVHTVTSTRYLVPGMVYDNSSTSTPQTKHEKGGPRAYVSDTCGTLYKSPQKPRRPDTTQTK